MSDWTYLLLVLPGFFVGVLVWSRIGHLLQIFIKVDTDSDATQETTTSSTRNQVFGAIVWVVCWLGLFGGLAYYVLAERSGSIGWFWFLVGMAVTPCIVLPPALVFWVRGRKRHADYDAIQRADLRSKETFVYEITFDKSYIRTLIDRYMRQFPTTRRPEALPILFAVAAAAIWLFDVFDETSFAFAVMVFVMGILGSLFAYWAARRILFSDLGYASHMGNTSTYKLSSDGLEVSGLRPWHKVLWPDLIKWPDFWIATRFRDGVFLFRGGALAWLPDSALADASPDDVARFIGERMRLRTAK